MASAEPGPRGRAGGAVAGNMAYYSHAIGRGGGLNIDDLAFLLAVQAEVRDDVLPALRSLRPTQAEAVAMWRGVLEDHEDELRQRLGLNDGADDSPAPDRPSVPRPVAVAAEFDEAALAKRNHCRPVFRVAERRIDGLPALGGLTGLGVGITAAFALDVSYNGAGILLIAGSVVMGFALGRRISGTRWRFRCATCESYLNATAELCPVCLGAIVGAIANHADRSRPRNAGRPVDASRPATVPTSQTAMPG